MKWNDLGEFGFIRRITSGRVISRDHVVIGPGDDAAAWRPEPGSLCLLTTDMLIEGIHFQLGYFEPEQLGHKSLAVNFSDIAAMGGKPRDAYLSLGIPVERLTVAFMDRFYAGVGALAGKWGVNILGGDTSHSSVLVISVTVTGSVAPDRVIGRDGASLGDRIFLTGHIGDAAAGLDLLLNRPQHLDRFADTLVKAHLEPQPHLEAAALIARSGKATAMIDVSDGVIQDLGHLCSGPGLGAVLYARDFPLSPALRSYASLTGMQLPDAALTGGEDYCLLFTASRKDEEHLRRLFSESGCPMYCIGSMSESGRIEIVDQNGRHRPVTGTGWDHFEKK